MKPKNRVPTPHDATFRQFLKLPEIARDFMELHLPAELCAICDFTTLTLLNGSFVEESLRQYFSDVLYSMKTTNGGEGYIHVLIEHQSSPDKHMAFRMVRYAVAAMQSHLDAGHRQLPLVIPVLFYTGKRTPYPYSTNWLQEFSDPELAKRLYSSDFPLVDITVIPDDDIMLHRSMAALTLLQKHIRQRNLAVLIDRLATLLLAGHLASTQVVALINYIVLAGDTADAEAFIRELALRIPQHKEELMTIAQQLEQNGIKKGIALGEQSGIQRGKLEGKLDVARAMLKHGIDGASVMHMTGLSEADLVRLND
ncbi:Rpn family recombination-promoting nuclease/putative transposase [Citrobacter sp. JGM124]|uniref:Rpn family recombination-promoting nuclease/putative transposase n=1 Tax=Citrobacter sp. JGM124 TaxID=2799789 RepID=UPI001BADDEDC|nr:Rpn family recombination-promoting nuclease/putative transposase [Citrobacter sp. JGM124]MBS0849176.1 Rpn family recombination-promoting nuclease/putative transposase [Citrobacter sp. JGM124]